MMSEEKTKDLLRKLPKYLKESVPGDLGRRIKQQIPHRLLPHRWGGETVNIIVHLRISRLTAVAAIVLTLVLCVRFYNANDPARSAGLYDDFKVLLNLLPGKEGTQADVQASLLRFQNTLASKGFDVVYLNNASDSNFAQALLMYWKLPSGEYNVIYRDLRMLKVDAEELIKLQSEMILHQRD
jgi:hypothetical protein